MPDFPELLATAARAAEPAMQPPFAQLRQRASRRVARRRTALALLVVGLVAVGGVALAAGHGSRQPLAAPCVPRTSENAGDVFATVPAEGQTVVDVFVHGAVTIGWQTCDETGTLTAPLGAKGFLDQPGTTAPAASFRYVVFGAGSWEIRGDGSAGSHGSVLIRATYRPEPDGMSSPSPYPSEASMYEGPELCKAGDVADADGYLTKRVTYASQHLMEPPGTVRSQHTRDEVLAAVTQAHLHFSNEDRAVFGLLTAENYGGGTRLPRWVVYRCGIPAGQLISHGGGVRLGPTPAPGTSPSPYGNSYGVELTLVDENLHPVYEESYGYSDDARLSQQLVEVPFERNHDDSADGRRVGITYPTYACATFSHLDVSEGDGPDPVYVRVWLRVTGDAPCDPSGSATAVVGLRYPLADRQLVRGEPRRG